MNAERLTFRAPAVAAIVISVLGLLSTATAGAWKAASILASIESKLDAVSDANLKARFYQRVEASRHHRDLEKALRNAGVRIEFPPPQDPADYLP